jgi:hypothetical protein
MGVAHPPQPMTPSRSLSFTFNNRAMAARLGRMPLQAKGYTRLQQNDGDSSLFIDSFILS